MISLPTPPFATRVAALLLLAVTLALAGCDVAGIEEDEAVLVYEVGAGVGDAIVFSIDPAAVETGVLVDIAANRVVDVEDFLNEQGFEEGDITSATLESANLELLFPRGESIDFLNTAILKFTAEGITATEVAEQTEFPDDDDVNLDIRSGRDVTTYLQADGFRPVLTIDAARFQEGAETYDLYLIMTFRIRVAV